MMGRWRGSGRMCASVAFDLLGEGILVYMQRLHVLFLDVNMAAVW